MNQSKGSLRDLSLPEESKTWPSVTRRQTASLGQLLPMTVLINPDPGLIPTQFLGKTYLEQKIVLKGVMYRSRRGFQRPKHS